MTRPTLGVHLIVRDEAALLPACLKSVAGADEIIIVDTGSEDHSITVAEAYGARVLQYKWDDDFSKARNTGLARATADWILILDADEVLNTPLDRIRQMLTGATAEAFTVSIDNLLGRGAEERLHHRAVRLFRGGQGYRYSGKIHEGIDQAIISRHGTAAIAHSDIRLLHYGYLPEIMLQKNKAARNEKLLRAAVAEHPEDDFYRYNLAVACCQTGQLQEAEELLRRTLNQAPLMVSYRPAMIRDLAKIYLAAGKLNAVNALLARELERYSDYPDLHYLQGQSWESQGLPERAFQAYQHAEALSANPLVQEKYVSEHGITTFRPLNRMGEIALLLGKPEEAARLFHRALQHFALYAPALSGIVTSFQRLAVPDSDIAALLLQLVPGDQPAGRAAIIRALYDADAFEAICGLPGGLIVPKKNTLLQISTAWIVTGEPETALSLIRSGLNQQASGDMSPELLQELRMLEALCLWGQGIPLQNSQLAVLPEGERISWHKLNQLPGLTLQRPAGEGDNAGTLADDPALSLLLTQLIPLAVKLRLIPVAEALAGLSSVHQAELAAALYKAGRLEEAGEHFIELAGDGLAGKRVAFYIAEMLHDKGHYEQAAGWFQQALAVTGQEDAARAGLSVCYLQLAAADLEKVLAGFGEGYPQGPVLEDLAAVKNAITALNRTPWHTSWSRRRLPGGAKP
ncbi:glycosyltransferase [Paenibacillus typhae]|uniref:Tetratricopeptide repeat-containing protein n=1 Tax=Paenibacillus typhae TaxID=1174501 RepID=A0A1G9BJ07_9BACL|nr:glycosyltransferase [Paenibacillus typhae]SDK39437.1 Tetratricopeptide repeat-containing protein [Paenibacillus typhae]